MPVIDPVEAVTVPVMSRVSAVNQVWNTGKPERCRYTKVRALIGALGSNHAAAPLVSIAAALPVRVVVAASQTGTSAADPVQDGLLASPGAQ